MAEDFDILACSRNDKRQQECWRYRSEAQDYPNAIYPDSNQLVKEKIEGFLCGSKRLESKVRRKRGDRCLCSV
jgi:hypothetical protein